VTKRKEANPDVITDIEIIPTVVGQGRYRLYKKPDGTMRVQFREDSADEDAFFEFPAALLVLAKNAAEGNMNPLQMMKEAAKLMGGIRPQ
jgi:hypothetical protein